jgi:hypothetical protein
MLSMEELRISLAIENNSRIPSRSVDFTLIPSVSKLYNQSEFGIREKNCLLSCNDLMHGMVFLNYLKKQEGLQREASPCQFCQRKCVSMSVRY